MTNEDIPKGTEFTHPKMGTFVVVRKLAGDEYWCTGAGFAHVHYFTEDEIRECLKKSKRRKNG